MRTPLKKKKPAKLRPLRGPRKQYLEERFKSALEAIKRQEMSVREAAKLYGVPRTTLQDRLNGAGDKDGRPTALSVAEEAEIVGMVKLLGIWGFPFTSTDLCHFVKSYLDKKGVVSVFKNNMPTHSFTVRFIGRHPDLSLRTANPIKRSRAAVTREDVTSFIEHWAKTIEGIPAAAIFNYDETNMRDDPGSKKCLFKKGTKYPEKVQNTSKQAYSVMFCGSAAGVMVPPMVVYKAQNTYHAWTDRGPKGAKYSTSQSGWFDSFQFSKWFFELMLPILKRIPGKKVLVGDNLASHINADVIKACRENQIEFVCLPPNSTDKLQPLDVTVFSPLKNFWRAALAAYKAKHPTICGISKTEFPSLLKQVLDQADLGRLLPVGFEKCGLLPVSVEKAWGRIPDKEMEVDTERMKELMDSTFGEKLEQLRGFTAAKAKVPRGKKIPPGKSYCGPNDTSSDEDDLGVQVDSPAEEEVEVSDKEEEEEDIEDLPSPTKKPVVRKKPVRGQDTSYIVGTYVAAIYQSLWYRKRVIFRTHFPRGGKLKL